MSARGTRLRRDERGAIAVLGVFFALFLVGMLYFGIGLGEAILLREHTQDSADATAYGGAVAGARAMNLIALANIATASSLGAVAALATVEQVTHAALILATGSDAHSLHDLLAQEQSVYNDALADADVIMAAAQRAARSLATGSDSAGYAAIAASGPAHGGVSTVFAYPADRPVPVEPEAAGLFCALVRARYTMPFARNIFDGVVLSAATRAAINAQIPAASQGATMLACAHALGSHPSNHTTLRLTAAAMADNEPFQLRGFALRPPRVDAAGRLVLTANRFRDDADVLSAQRMALAQMGRVALAQAEFYYSGNEPAAEWLWNPNWRARLRRFRVPPGLDAAQLAQTCDKTGIPDRSGCGAIGLIDLARVAAAVVH